MIHFVTEQLAGSVPVEYSVSVEALDSWAKIVSHGPEGLDVLVIRATWDGESLDVTATEGDADRLFTPWVQQKIEGAIAEHYAALPDCGDSGHPTVCGCDNRGEFASTVTLAQWIEMKMADETEAWTLLQAMGATVCPEPTAATTEGRERTRLAIAYLVRSGHVYPVRVNGHERFRVNFGPGTR